MRTCGSHEEEVCLTTQTTGESQVSAFLLLHLRVMKPNPLKMEKVLLLVAIINGRRCDVCAGAHVRRVTASCDAASELNSCLLHIWGRGRCHFLSN